jgi:hypothetical protein
VGIESNQSTPEFDEFVAAGEVEVGDTSGKGGVEKDEGDDDEPKKAKRGPPKPAPAAKEPAKADDDDDDDEGGEEGDDDEGGEEGDEDAEKKPKKSAKDHQIERLKREKAALARQLREGGGNADLARRLENVEKGLSGGNGSDTKTVGTEPDPSDTAKYPLGHLDDRYIEDKLEWLADKKATERADAVLQRQQESERTQATTAAQEALLDQVDELSTKGSEQFEDFQELVVDAGMRGDWPLKQATFEAAHEAENGAQILYDLSQDPREARRVARLSNFQQMKFVQERDAEIGTGKKGRTKPRAGEPPKNTARGANSKTSISPATDNLEDFGKAWEQDAKKAK